MHASLFHVYVGSCACMCVFYSFEQWLKLWTEHIWSLGPFSQDFFRDILSSLLCGDIPITIRETVIHRTPFSKEFLLSFLSLLIKWEPYPGKGILLLLWSVLEMRIRIKRWKEKKEQKKKERGTNKTIMVHEV